MSYFIPILARVTITTNNFRERYSTTYGVYLKASGSYDPPAFRLPLYTAIQSGVCRTAHSSP